MKKLIKENIQTILSERYFLILIVLFFVQSVTFSIILFLSIKPSELQLVSHYSAYGITHLYRDQWFYLFVFPIFQIASFILNTLISIKLLIIKDRDFAVTFLLLGSFISVIGLFVALSVLNVWTPL